MKKLGVAIIGLGHWGPNLLRALSDDSRVEIRVLCDLNENRLSKMAAGTYRCTPDPRVALTDPSIDAVFICTPTFTHFELALAALKAGKHVFVEKPLAQTTRECEALVELAEQSRLKLMVGHIFLFNEGVRFVKELIDAGSLGSIIYAYSSRLNLGPIRTDVNVLWDLAAHDISIFNYWFQGTPELVSASGSCFLNQKLEDVAFVSLRYPENLLVNLHVSWLDPRKVREIIIVGTKQMVVFDDLNPLGPVFLYDKSVEVASESDDSIQNYKMIIQDGTLTVPKIRTSEPLKTECRAFIDWIQGSPSPEATGIEGRNVVQVLESVSNAMSRNMHFINI